MEDSYDEKLAMGDEILKIIMFKLKCSKVEIQAIVDVDGPRLKKIRKSMVKTCKEAEAMESMKKVELVRSVVRKPVHQAATKEDYDRILNHIR